MQCLATRSNNFNLDVFNDKSDLLGKLLCITCACTCVYVYVCVLHAHMYTCMCCVVCVLIFRSHDSYCLSLPTAYDMSSYIRKYGRYLNTMTASYRALAMDICRLTKG